MQMANEKRDTDTMHYVITTFPVVAQIGPFATRGEAEAFNLTLEDAEGFSIIDTDLNMTPEQYAVALAKQSPEEYNDAAMGPI
jgi:hypothetical protein